MITCRVSRIKRINSTITLIELKSKNAALPRFAPGSHVSVRLPNGVEREYSLLGPNAKHPTKLRIAVRLEPHGRGGSAYIHSALKRGDSIEILRIANHFPFHAEPRTTFIAAGIGITAILPMVHEAQARQVDWNLTYVGPRRADMAFIKDVRRLGSRARIVETRANGRPEMGELVQQTDAVYACGPETLLDELAMHCERRKLTLHVERFTSSFDFNSIERHSFTVTLSRSNKEVEVAQDERLSDALERADRRVRTSCLAGICGSCEVVVTAGEIDHFDSVLKAEQPAPGCPVALMSCVSRARGQHLTLDI